MIAIENKIEEFENSTERKNIYECNSYYAYSVSGNYLLGANLFSNYSQDTLKSLIIDPMENNQELRKISRLIYNSNGVVTKAIDYKVSLPTLDSVVCTTGKSKKVNKQLVEDFLTKIRDKEFVRDCLFNDSLDGTVFRYIEFSGNKRKFKKYMEDYEVTNVTEINSNESNVSAISLPIDYCKIIGFKNGSPVGAFNLEYFNNFEGDTIENKLKKYPKEIRDAYNNKQRNGNWIVLDNNKTIIHKVRCSKDEPWGRPSVLAAIIDVLYSDYYTDTKRNLLDELNNQFIYQTFPEGKEKGTSSLTVDQQKTQHEAVKSALLNKNNRGGKSFASVAAGTKIDSMTTDTSLFKDDVEQNLGDDIATDLGIGIGLLDGKSGTYSSQQINLELMFAEIYRWIEEISYELNKVINANVIKANSPVEVYYLPCSRINRDKVITNAKELYMSGNGSKSYWIASMGIKPSAYLTLMDMEVEEKWDEKYPCHTTAYTKSKDDTSKNGRPVNDDTTNDNTLATKGNDSNNQPKPSNNK